MDFFFRFPFDGFTFSSDVSDEDMKRVSSSPKLLQRVKAFEELNVDFVSSESRLFTLDSAKRSVIPNLYFPSSPEVV